MQILLICLFVLNMVNLVCHGICVLIGLVIQALPGLEALDQKDPDDELPLPRRRNCARCGALLLPSMRRCVACGLESHANVAVELKDLETTARQLSVLVKDGALDAETQARLQKCIDARKHSLTWRP